MVTRGLVTPRVVANGPAGVPRGGTTAKVSFPPGITQFLREVKLPEDKGGSREDREEGSVLGVSNYGLTSRVRKLGWIFSMDKNVKTVKDLRL